MTRRSNPSDNTFFWLALFGIGGYYLYKSGWLSKILAGPVAVAAPGATAPVVITRPNTVAAPPPPGIIVQPAAPSVPATPPVSFTPGGPLPPADVETDGQSETTTQPEIPTSRSVSPCKKRSYVVQSGPPSDLYTYLLSLGFGQPNPYYKSTQYAPGRTILGDLPIEQFFQEAPPTADQISESETLVGTKSFLEGLRVVLDQSGTTGEWLIDTSAGTFAGGEASLPGAPLGALFGANGERFETTDDCDLVSTTHNIKASSPSDAVARYWSMHPADMKFILDVQPTANGYYRLAWWQGFSLGA